MLTIGIPCIRESIFNTLKSIDLNNVKIIIAMDSDKILNFDKKFKILSFKKQLGPALNRQRILDNCDTKYITFIDDDDTFLNKECLLKLLEAFKENTIRVSGDVYLNGENKINTDVLLHGSIYNVELLKKHNINFGNVLCEDDYFNTQIKYFSYKNNYEIKKINIPVYNFNIKSDKRFNRKNMELEPKFDDNCMLYALSKLYHCMELNTNDIIYKQYKEITLLFSKWVLYETHDFFLKLIIDNIENNNFNIELKKDLFDKFQTLFYNNLKEKKYGRDYN